MLRIIVPLAEVFDEETSEFAIAESFELELEHSLVSLSKWESKWKVPFLRKEKMTQEQTIDYIRCMISGEIPSDKDLARLRDKDFAQIRDYIEDEMTATWFNERHAPKGTPEIVTAELIYYWMIALDIPFECQSWHLSRLLTLIKVCNYKNAKPTKMSKSDAVAEQRRLNKIRRQKTGSKG